MALRTTLFSFKLSSDSASNSIDLYLQNIGSTLQKYFPTLSQVNRVSLGDSNGFLVIYTSPTSNGITFTLRYYLSEQLFTLNGEASNKCDEFGTFNNLQLEHLQEDIEKALNLKLVERLPVLKRNSSTPLYFLTSDNRILEYDFDQVLVHEKSKFQDIKILHSPSLGNALLLDDLQNLAEADINYTRGLMNYGNNSYKDKEILILGGGDGGLLHELLKESPKFVTMVDIDELVMKYCQKHLRGACGESLDTYKGQNYEVIVGDCIEYMKEYINSNRSFDYVFNDLTDIPISTQDNKDILLENSGEKWEFVKQILQMSLQLVRPDGKYLNHAIGVSCTNALEEYEDLLKNNPVKLGFAHHSAFVPSFLEEWVFYQIWKV